MSIFASMLYVAADVESVRQLWSRSGALAGLDIRSQLEAYAEALNAAVAAQDPGAAVLVKNWWNAEVDGPLPSRIGERAAVLIAARDHGFHAWSSVGGRCDERFELAVDAVIEGRIGDLTELLAADANLVAQRSRYGHCATLLHYTAANGVEIRRQVVPENAAAVGATLIAAGADPRAHFSAYGASVDVLQMLRSSARLGRICRARETRRERVHPRQFDGHLTGRLGCQVVVRIDLIVRALNAIQTIERNRGDAQQRDEQHDQRNEEARAERTGAKRHLLTIDPPPRTLSEAVWEPEAGSAGGFSDVFQLPANVGERSSGKALPRASDQWPADPSTSSACGPPLRRAVVR